MLLPYSKPETKTVSYDVKSIIMQSYAFSGSTGTNLTFDGDPTDFDSLFN